MQGDPLVPAAGEPVSAIYYAAVETEWDILAKTDVLELLAALRERIAMLEAQVRFVEFERDQAYRALEVRHAL